MTMVVLSGVVLSFDRFQTAQRTHMDKMQQFIHLHLEKVHQLEDEFERDLKALKNEFQTERYASFSQRSLICFENQ